MQKGCKSPEVHPEGIQDGTLMNQATAGVATLIISLHGLRM